METTFYIHFDTSLSEANNLVVDLQEYLDEHYNQPSEIKKEKDNTQDAGSILAIILGASSVVEIAKGVALWMQKKNNITISIKDKNGEVLITGARSQDIPETFKGYANLPK